MSHIAGHDRSQTLRLPEATRFAALFEPRGRVILFTSMHGSDVRRGPFIYRLRVATES